LVNGLITAGAPKNKGGKSRTTTTAWIDNKSQCVVQLKVKEVKEMLGLDTSCDW